jgi:hypothetical protein
MRSHRPIDAGDNAPACRVEIRAHLSSRAMPAAKPHPVLK